MMTPEERVAALKRMRTITSHYYNEAVHVGVHPFIEFAGLINEYVKVCEEAHAKGIDFSECHAHSGIELPMQPHHIDYVNEKLECIYTGRSVLQQV